MTRRQRLITEIEQKIQSASFCMNIRMEDDTVAPTRPLVRAEEINKAIREIIDAEFDRKPVPYKTRPRKK